MEGVYGLAARLPKDTESFGSFYRLSTLWDGFRKSNFVKKVLANEELVRELDLDDLLSQWENNPVLQQYGTMAGSMLGSEVHMVLPAGFSVNLSVLLKNLPQLQSAWFMARVSAVGEDPGMPAEMLPLVEAAAALELPPVIIALKAGDHKDELQALIGQALAQIPSEARGMLDFSKSEISGGSFDHLLVKVSKVMPPDAQKNMRRDLAKAAGGKEKGDALADKLLAKTVELSWGWLDGYFIVSVGSGHGHLKFVSAADSVLTLPEVAPRAAQFAPKNPLTFGYTSQKLQRTIGELGGLFETLASLAETAKKAGAPIKLDNVITELRKLDTKAKELMPNDPEAMVGASWWDGGLRGESFGGAKLRAFDSSKPLTLGSLANDKTLLLLEGRANGPFRDKVFSMVEDTITAVWGIYQKEVKPQLPSETKQQVAMGEMVAVPMVKELWKSFQAFRAAMGNESALILNLDGVMPSILQLNLPPDFVEKGKVPRMVWVSELADRKKLAEAWSGLKTIISSAAAIAGSQSGMNIPTEPVTVTEGGVEMFGFKLPIDTGDAWPHTAASATHWFFSTAPSLTKEIAGKTPAADGPASGSHWKVNATALWNFADAWAKILPAPPEALEHMEFALSLARAFSGLDVRLAEENGQPRASFHLQIQDVK